MNNWPVEYLWTWPSGGSVKDLGKFWFQVSVCCCLLLILYIATATGASKHCCSVAVLMSKERWKYLRGWGFDFESCNFFVWVVMNQYFHNLFHVGLLGLGLWKTVILEVRKCASRNKKSAKAEVKVAGRQKLNTQKLKAKALGVFLTPREVKGQGLHNNEILLHRPLLSPLTFKYWKIYMVFFKLLGFKTEWTCQSNNQITGSALMTYVVQDLVIL